MPRWHVYVNRAAGRRPVDPALVGQILAGLGLDAEIFVPESREETTALIQEAARAGGRHFAVTGGDGTVNLAVNALMPLGLDTRPVLGVLPVGTGCDLLRTFGLPQDLLGAARHLSSADTYDIDVATVEGEWGTRYFANVAQTGVGAAGPRPRCESVGGSVWLATHSPLPSVSPDSPRRRSGSSQSAEQSKPRPWR